MKNVLSSSLLGIAIDFVHRARAANAEGRLDQEVEFSIGAQLMIALAIEGVGNGIGEVWFDSWTWDRLEKSDTPLKWRLLSGIESREPFDPGSEPLQTVQRLSTIRNRIAHPKLEDLGTELIIRSEDGEIHRNVDPHSPVIGGDTIILGVGKLLDEGFNAKSSHELTRKAIEAIQAIRQHLAISGFDWIDHYEKKLKA